MAGAGLGQVVAWAPPLSHGRLTLGDGGATATRAWYGAPHYPAALVAVGRGGGAEGFALAAVVEALPKMNAYSYFSFGVGRAMPKEGKGFGGTADGTCGLQQLADSESYRGAATKGFGRRADRDDDKLGRPIVRGSRLALHLSPRGAEGRRTARFFVDKEEVAVFADIEDDGGDSDWVAGAHRIPVDPSCPFLVHTFKTISHVFSPRFLPFSARFHRLDEAVPTSPKPEPRAKKQPARGPRGENFPLRFDTPDA
eukprot:COSAG04_NODE_1423_length_6828_cov_13.718978_1_plen_254_part_00